MGVWVQLLQLLGYLTLMDWGISVFLPRDVATTAGRASGWSAAADLPGLIRGYARIVFFWQTPVLAAAAAAVGLVAANRWPDWSGPVWAIVVAYVATFPLRLAVAVLTGVQDYRFSGLVMLCGGLVGSGTTVGLAMVGAGTYALPGGWIAGQVFGAIACWTRIAISYRPLLPVPVVPVSSAEAKRILIIGGWQTLSTLGATLAGASDLVVLGFFSSADSVICYGLTAKLAVMFTGLVQPLCLAVMPGLSEMRASHARDRVSSVLIAYSQGVLVFSGWLACLMLATNAGFVAKWVGGQYYLGDQTTVLLGVVMILRHLNNGLAVALFAVHRERPMFIVTLVDGLVTVAATTAVAATLGPVWLPLGSLIGIGCVGLPLNLYLLRSAEVLTPGRLARSLGWLAIPWVAPALIAVGAAWYFEPHQLWSLAAISVGMSIVYAGAVGRAARRQEIGRYLGPVISQFPVFRWFLFVLRPSGLSVDDAANLERATS
jgi:O-antigen/teichoic acid export membrane protein